MDQERYDIRCQAVGCSSIAWATGESWQEVYDTFKSIGWRKTKDAYFCRSHVLWINAIREGFIE